MSQEKIPSEEGMPFPKNELKAWLEYTYPDRGDKYSQELKKAHLKAIEKRSIPGLQKIYTVMFVQLSRLRQDAPDDWISFSKTLKELEEWLGPNRP